MRLIDEVAAREKFHNNLAYMGTDVKRILAAQPTINPNDLRPHGRWIDKPTGAYGRWQSWCSVCGKHSGIGGIESNRHKTYCPNCGAKMDGKE